MASFMVIEQKEKACEWEEKMIRNRRPPHLLLADTVQKDGEVQLWYDITGRQSLDVILETTGLNYELLCHVLLGIYEMIQTLQGLLLDTGRLLLIPESIFFDYRLEEISFCYYPGNEQNGESSFVALMEYLLPHLNHQDEAGVELAYSVYEQACKGSFGFSLLKDIVHISYEKDYERAEDINGQQNVIREAEETEADTVMNNSLPQRKLQGWQLMKRRGAAKREKRAEKEPAKTEPVGVGALKAGKISLQIKKLWAALHRILESKILERRENQEEPFVFEAEEEEMLPERPTVLLSEINMKPEGILCYEGVGNGKSLKVDGTCLIVGSDAAGTGYIPSATVSRRHARIIKEDDTYWLEDLNSVNGTYLNGKALNYKEKVLLQRNCLVQFADEKFRFI
jgi:hypothetical protein